MSRKTPQATMTERGETKVLLIKYPRRKYFAIVMTMILTVLFTLWIWANMQKGNVPWYVIALPMIFIGMLANFLQPDEEWQYTPWQNATQKYEKNIYDLG